MEKFIWGAATSAYQIEGAHDKDGRKPSIWDSFSSIKGNIANNDTGNIACDHYHRYPEDIRLIKNLGVDAYRLSLSWSRIIPDGTGQINQKGVDFYNRLIDGLLEQGIDPWVTLYHWDLPQALQDRGGWTQRDIVSWFEEYTAVVAKSFGDRINNYIVLNEPSITSYLGHYLGIFAPGIKNFEALCASTHHQNLAQGTGARALRAMTKSPHIGSSYTYFTFYPKNADSTDDIKAAAILDAVWTRNFLEPLIHKSYPALTVSWFESLVKQGDLELISTPVDYIGINHYSPNYVSFTKDNELNAVLADGPADYPRTDIGWVINPQDLTKSLHDIKSRYNDPLIYITENGACDNKRPDSTGQISDDLRIQYYSDYLNAVLTDAEKREFRLGGYFAWSLMDNFEWAHGNAMRFGLIDIDYQTLKRTPKKSYDWYKNYILSYRNKSKAA